MKNILIPLELNGSKLEGRIIETAISYAKILNAKCWVVHIAAPEPDFVGYEVGPQYIRDELAEDLREEHREVQTVANLFKEHKIACQGLLIQGATKEMIEIEIEKLKIDLLILGNKKHGFFDVFFEGSVSEALVDEVNIPILLIPDNE
jgi:nucleotide-binding universal stress UspA family protein